jgi:Ca2+-binding EF-hand superfamily protein
MKRSFLVLGLTLAANALAQSPNTSPPRDAMQGGGQTAEESFKRRDTNNDGLLSKTEVAGSRAESSFDKFDANHDGKLSLAEYKAARDSMQTQGSQGQQGQMADQRFKELDKNSDGFISKDEMSGSRMADRFDQMDSSHDGKLSLNEFKAGMQSMRQNMGSGMGGMGAQPNSNPQKSTT